MLVVAGKEHLVCKLFCAVHRSYGVTLWYPSYVGIINQQQLCRKKISTNQTGNSDSLQELCGCADTAFHNITVRNLELTTWSLEKATFTDVFFLQVNFSRVELTSSTFVNCTFKDVHFKSALFNNISWKNVTLDNMLIESTKICSCHIAGASIEDGSSLIMRDVLMGEKELLEEYVNDSTFAQLAPSAEASCPSSSEIGRNINVECESLEDYKIYRDNFIIAASATPGMIMSSIAVYFFRRNLWMGTSLS